MATSGADVIYEILLKVNPKGTQDVEKYLKALESLGLRWNEQAKRFQEVQGKTGGSGFVGNAALERTLREMVTEEHLITAAKESQLKYMTEMADMRNRDIQAGEAVLQYAKDTGMEVVKAAQAMSDMAIGNQRSWQQLAADAQAASNQGFIPAQKAADGTAVATQQIAKNTNLARQNMADLREGFLGFQLMMTGMSMQRTGMKLLSPISQYTSYAGMGDTASAEWLRTQRDIEGSFARIGRVMTQQMLPAMREIANLSEDIAGFMEKNPELVGAVAKTGGGLVVGGSALMILGQIWSGMFAMRQLFGMAVTKLGLTAVATTAGGTAVAGAPAIVAGTGMTVGSLFAVILAGITAAAAESGIKQMIGGAIKKGLGIEEDTWANWLIDRLEEQLIGGPPGMTNPLTVLSHQLPKIQEGATALIEFAGGAKKVTEELIITNEQLDAMSKYLDAEAEAAKQYNEELAAAEEEYVSERSDMVEKHGADMARAEEDYLRQRSDAVEEFGKDMARAEADYLRERQQSLDDFGRDAARRQADFDKKQTDAATDFREKTQKSETEYKDKTAEAWEDYYKRLRELQMDHEAKQDDLIAKRDAGGLVDEERRYQRELQKAKEDLDDKLNDMTAQHEAERAADWEAFAKQQADESAQFAQDEAQRKADFELELARKAEEFKIDTERRKADFEAQQKQADEEFKIRQKRAEDEFRAELLQLDAAHREKIADLRRQYEQERRERSDELRKTMQELLKQEQDGNAKRIEETKAYVTKMLAEYDRLKTAGTAGAQGSKQSGGYVSDGLWRLHNGEYVLNPQTTAAAQRSLGGRLTQSAILASLAGGRPGTMANAQMNVYYPAGAMTSQMQKMVSQGARRALEDNLDRLLEEM
jgi:hypothetical protein